MMLNKYFGQNKDETDFILKKFEEDKRRVLKSPERLLNIYFTMQTIARCLK